MRRLALIGLCLAVLAGAPGCGPGGGSTAETGDVPRTKVPARDPDVVLSVYTTGVGGDPGTLVPDFQLHRDGTVFLNGDGPLGIDTYRLSDPGVDKVLELFADIPLADDAYGDLTVTDLSSTTVYLNDGGGPYGTRVYGLEFGGDPDLLGDDEAQSRRRLRDALAELDELSATAAAGTSKLVAAPREHHTPDELDVTLDPLVPDDGEDPASPGFAGDALPWPLAKPFAAYPLRFTDSGVACLTVQGADVAAAVGTTEEPAEGVVWSTGARRGTGVPTHVIAALHGVVPGSEPSPHVSCGPGPVPDRISSGPLWPVVLASPAEWDGRFGADSFEAAKPLEILAATPILAAGMRAHDERAEDRPDDSDLQVPTESDLTWYEFEAVIANVGDRRYVDLEARRKTPTDTSGRTDPPTWRARIDLAEQRVVDVQLDAP